jgi:predicted permease
MLLIFLEILPLLLIIIVGMAVRRLANVHPVVLASLLIFIATPTVVFLGAYNLYITIGLILLPFIIFTISVTFSLLCERFTRTWWQDGTHRLLAVSVGTSNTGYFGLPMCIAILGPESLPMAVMYGFGQILYENTLGYYLAARHQHTIIEARNKILKLPAIYALILGLLLNFYQVELNGVVENTLTILRGMYTPLGMMIIGVTIMGLSSFKFDVKYIAALLFNKMIMWPAAIIALIALDYYMLNIFPHEVYPVLLIQSIAPAAANSAAFAAQFDMHPEKASLGVLISTLIAVIYVPLVGVYAIEFL